MGRSFVCGALTALAAAGTVWIFHALPETIRGLGHLITKALSGLPVTPVSPFVSFGAALGCGVAAAWVGSVIQPRRTAWGLVAAGCLLAVTQSMIMALHHTLWEPLPAVLAMAGGCLAASWRNRLPAGASPWFKDRVSPEVLEKLSEARDLAFLSADQRQGTVLTCRLLNEGPLREMLPAQDFLKLCEAFRARAAGVLLPHGACLDPTESTGVRAFFGLPLASETAADDAVKAALALEAAFGETAAGSGSGDSFPAPVCGTGLSSGIFTAGLTGNTYTVLGDPVEVSRWLASRNSDYHTRTLLDSATHLRAARVEDRPLEVLNPPEGAAMEIFHLLGIKGSLSMEELTRRDAFRDAIILLRAGHAEDAIARFADAREGLSEPDAALDQFLAQAADQVRRDGAAPPGPAAVSPPLPLPLPPRRRNTFPRKLPRP
ncbi:MAG: hypothetical protein V4726_14160 [Verrucomicrobiota bacterium]